MFAGPPEDPAAAGAQAAGNRRPQPTLYLHGADDGCMGIDMIGPVTELRPAPAPKWSWSREPDTSSTSSGPTRSTTRILAFIDAWTGTAAIRRQGRDRFRAGAGTRRSSGPPAPRPGAPPPPARSGRGRPPSRRPMPPPRWAPPPGAGLDQSAPALAVRPVEAALGHRDPGRPRSRIGSGPAGRRPTGSAGGWGSAGSGAVRPRTCRAPRSSRAWPNDHPRPGGTMASTSRWASPALQVGRPRPGTAPGRRWCPPRRRRPRRRRPARPGPCRPPRREGPAARTGPRAPAPVSAVTTAWAARWRLRARRLYPSPRQGRARRPGRRRARRRGREGLQEPVVGGDHPGQLGLLGHDFAHQHGPRDHGWIATVARGVWTPLRVRCPNPRWLDRWPRPDGVPDRIGTPATDDRLDRAGSGRPTATPGLVKPRRRRRRDGDGAGRRPASRPSPCGGRSTPLPRAG